MIHFEVTPVPRSKPEDLNETLLVEYFRRVRDIGYEDKPKWLRLLIDNQILSEELGAVNCTLAGLILFGKKDRVKKLIPQSGITAVEYDSPDADVAGRFRKEINGPLISLRENSGVIAEEGIIDQSVNFVLRVRSKEKIEGIRRVTEYAYPPEVLRDMDFIEGSGRGVSRKIIRGMIKHNGKEPGFELRGEALRVTLYA